MYSVQSQAYSRPLTQEEADVHGLGNSSGYRAIVNPGSEASIQIVPDPPAPSNSMGQGAPSVAGSSSSANSSWVMPNGPINHPGPMHLHQGQRINDQGGSVAPSHHPVQNNQMGTIQGLQQPPPQQQASAPETPDTYFKALADYFGKLAATAPIRMGQGGNQGGGGRGGGGMPPNHLAVNFHNKIQALGVIPIVNAGKQTGKGKNKTYPDLTGEGGGPPPPPT